MASLASSALKQAGRRLCSRSAVPSRLQPTASRIAAAPALPATSKRGYVSESKRDAAQVLNETPVKPNLTGSPQAQDPSGLPVAGSLPAAIPRALAPAQPVAANRIPRTTTEAIKDASILEQGLRPIYLDMQSTTPVDPRVLDAMLPFYVGE